MEKELDHIRRSLADSGFKWTGQRRKVISVFFQNSSRHMSAEEIYAVLQGQDKTIGLATVYRTLEIMVETGLVHKLEFGDGCSRYELSAGNEHHHHHLVCSGCGEIYEVALDLLEELEQKIELEYGFFISGHHLKFYGLCSKCKNKEKDGGQR